MNPAPPPLAIPPVPATEPVSSFHHKAASYGVLIIPTAIALNVTLVAGVSAALSEAPPLVRAGISAIPGFLILSALPAGVIALCGIPKYGRKKLLWKGLVGVLVPVLLFAMAMFAFLKVRDSALKRARQSQHSP